MIKKKPKCDKCGHMEFRIVSDDEEQVVSASEYFKGQDCNGTVGISIGDCTFGTPNYKATCMCCGVVYRY